jgi:flagellar protein FliO/FliZ
MNDINLLTAGLTAGAALVAVLAALLLAARMARAAGMGPRAGRRLSVEETLALDGRRRLVLLRCDGRNLLLLTGGGQDQVIGWLPEGGPPSA